MGRNVVNHPILYRVAPYIKSYQTPSVNSVKVKNPGVRAVNQENKTKAEMPLIAQLWPSSVFYIRGPYTRV